MEVDGFAEANQLLCSALEQLDDIIASGCFLYSRIMGIRTPFQFFDVCNTGLLIEVTHSEIWKPTS
ncbi:hypothetical protein Tcan_03323 [Toxocara canis]|uniref:Uncharacterized protein n=1 Tax=Toxocara canis TaxID=6265 RepID=A0A0B2VZ19_TOXCA|nr:hypothetical protein Tcan_03323 [Toxocara canis]